jgi:hypothetical protein
MPETTGAGPTTQALDVRLSVPAEGELRDIAAELAAKIAEHLGVKAADAASLSATVSGLASRVAGGGQPDITFDFRQVDRELIIEARCAGQASEVRLPLTA